MTDWYPKEAASGAAKKIAANAESVIRALAKVLDATKNKATEDRTRRAIRARVIEELQTHHLQDAEGEKC